MRYTNTIVCSLFAMTSIVGCATDDTAEEDAAADAAPNGKADAAGFRLGLFTVDEPDVEAKVPIAVAFHENGQLDFTRFTSDDYKTEYSQGTFKVYTYRGQNRIRLTASDGSVLLRSGWSIDADGALEFGDQSWVQATRSPTDVASCITMQVQDENAFEESLSVYEYPDVSLETVGSSYTMHIGDSSLDATEATFMVWKTVPSLVASAVLASYTVTMRVSNVAPRRGELLYQAHGDAAPHTVANIVCR
jgi:hypothetical protein